MRTIDLDTEIVIEKEILKENIALEKSDDSIPIINAPEKRFGIVDLWNIRRKGKYIRNSRSIL